MQNSIIWSILYKQNTFSRPLFEKIDSKNKAFFTLYALEWEL